LPTVGKVEGIQKTAPPAAWIGCRTRGDGWNSCIRSDCDILVDSFLKDSNVDVRSLLVLLLRALLLETVAFMTNDDLAERVASIAALADPIRRDLYFYVTAQPTPVSRDRASDALGIARHTAKFHLDKLTEEGLLDIEFKRLTERRGPGAGRPTKLYRRSSRQLSVTLPERRYDLAAQLLASAVEVTADGTLINDSLKVAAADSGRSVGDQARAAAGPQASRERLLDCTCEALSECGYAPRRTGSTIVLSNCPFDTLAREHTQLICGMNLAMLAAVIEQVQETALSARLEPATNRCCVVLDAS
jgi:predicted ArsR family transcriptional regulator